MEVGRPSYVSLPSLSTNCDPRPQPVYKTNPMICARNATTHCNKASPAVCGRGVPAAVQRQHRALRRSLGPQTRGHSCVIDAFAYVFNADCVILLVPIYTRLASRYARSLLAFTGRDQQVCCDREVSSCMWCYLCRLELWSHPFAAPSIIFNSSNSMSCAPAVRLNVPFPPP